MPPKSRYAYLPAAFVTGWLLSLARLGYDLATGKLGANPIATALNQLGLLSLVLLVACACCTPLKLAFGITWPLRVRRTLGLLAFFTALLHFAFYLGPDQGFELNEVGRDLVKRPFIAVGFLALLLMVPLAWTSSKHQVKRLTFPVWQRLHRLIYVILLLAAAHFYLRVKADHTQPLVYAALIALGFALRLVALRAKRRARRLRAG